MSYFEPDIISSYKKVPVFGRFFYEYVLKYKPKVIVEFGTRFGYSAICMGQALRDLEVGHLTTYDTLQEAGFSQLMEIHANIKRYELEDWVDVQVQDFFEWIENPTPFDLLHVDIDNTGNTIKLLSETFPGKHIIFEGGIPSRDRPYQVPIVGSVPYEILVPEFPALSKIL